MAWGETFPESSGSTSPLSDLPWYRNGKGLRKCDKARISAVMRRIKMKGKGILLCPGKVLLQENTGIRR